MSSVFVGNVYIPEAKVSALDLLEDSLEKVSLVKKVNDSFVIFGNFNMRDITWSPNGDGYADVINMNSLCSYSSRFIETMNYFELVQHNVHLTCNGNQLDLV